MSVLPETGPEAAPLLAGAARACASCGAALCLRKQVVNLALGHVESMFCLVCLAVEVGRSPQTVLLDMKAYVEQRECFRKEWERYLSVAYCPDPDGCFPRDCFGLKQPGASDG